MTIEECYEVVGGDFEEVLERLMRKELVQKFLFRFPEDKSFSALMAALDKKDTETAFRMAHTLKGLSQNLGLKKLYESSARLTEELRPMVWKDFEAISKQVEEDYNLTVSAIGQLKESV